MSDTPNLPEPRRFNLERFSDLLPPREPLIGDGARTFEDIEAAIMASYAPATPHECMILSNLADIKWQIFNHPRMRDATLNERTREAVQKAYRAKAHRELTEHNDEKLREHIEQGGTEEDFKGYGLNHPVVDRQAQDLANRATSRDRATREAALAEITVLGIDPAAVMSAAYESLFGVVVRHQDSLVGLERRRRRVLQDFYNLVHRRPIEGEVIEA